MTTPISTTSSTTTSTPSTASKRKPRPWYMPRRSRRPQRLALVILALVLAMGVYAVHSVWRTYVEYPDRPGLGRAEPISLTVPSGASFPVVLDLLVEHEVIAESDATLFRLFVLDEGAAGKVTAGKHEFRGDMTAREILAELQRRQPVIERRVTIPEGKHMVQVADLLAEAGLGDRQAFITAMRDPALLERLGVPGPSLEGYLFPDTYKFAAGATPEQILERMVKRHQQVYAELQRKYRAGATTLEQDLGWGDREIVIMASLIEKETGQAAERPRIASVFLNRLRFASFKPKLLQTDPTIIYGCTVPIEKSSACKQFEGRIRKIHLRDPENPYNTYTHEGLPPGPIANPGRDALAAVLAPETTRYLYFVARNDGTHQFSKSREEHEAAVEKYIRGGAKGDGTVQD
ncbi:endolytic transglycosylase MltG [Nannocystaceae bacterium ST9]